MQRTRVLDASIVAKQECLMYFYCGKYFSSIYWICLLLRVPFVEVYASLEECESFPNIVVCACR